MADEIKPTNDPQNDPEPTPNPAADNAAGGDDKTLAARIAELEAENEKLKANSRKWEKRSKENAAAAKAADEANQQKATAEERLAKIEAELNEAKAKDARLQAASEVAKANSMTVEAVLAMAGDTVEELTASATAIKSAIPTYPVVKPGANTNPNAVTADAIRKIKNPVERVRMRAEHSELFE